ncbi:hypothetical protein C8R43DRAFT_945303 [Mycena crocata]|nr:hypothetical protein C8R43DRAFT_945303 [Mycena crocata]
MSRKKREQKRVPRAERKNLRLWAEGVRETILSPHLDGYTAALDQGWRQERAYCKKVCLEFHSRVDWQTEDHEEPVLDENWDASALKEKSKPLSPEQEKTKRGRMKVLDKRIRRWFTYRIRRIRKHRSSAGLDPTKDPYAVLLAKLSGLTAPPKARQGFQQWMRETPKDEIEPVVQARWAEEQEKGAEVAERTKEPKVGFRAAVARSIFNGLPQAEQKSIGARATQEASAAKAAYTTALKNTPSTKPEDRQKCIDAIPDFVGPILRGLSEYTGMHATLIMGGPMPKYGGDIRTVHTSYGRNKATIPTHWGQWNKQRFQQQVADYMIEYLQTAFKPEDCAAAALAPADVLSGAKYRIDDTKKAESDSDSESSSSDSEPDSDSSASELEEEGGKTKRQLKKKRKRSQTKAAAATTPSASDSNSDSDSEERARDGKRRKRRATPESTVPIYQDGLTYDQLRTRNIERNAASLRAIVAEQELADPTPAPRPKPRPRHKDVSSGPTRTSTRRRTGGAGSTSAPATQAPTTSTPAPATSSPFLPTAASTSTPPATSPPSTLSSSAPGTTTPPAITPSILVACPAKAALWFIDARAEMTKVDLGCHFQALLTAWTRVEDASRFEHGPQNLATIGRPTELKTWIARKRGKTGPDPIVTDPSAYALKWQGWWDSLQPAWREKSQDGTWVAEGPYGPDGKEWGELYRWGVNGTLTIVASLYFWGLAVISDAGVFKSAWVVAVNDVCWMMEGLATFYEMFNKRF